MLSSPTTFDALKSAFFDAFNKGSVTFRCELANDQPGKNPATFGVGQGARHRPNSVNGQIVV